MLFGCPGHRNRDIYVPQLGRRHALARLHGRDPQAVDFISNSTSHQPSLHRGAKNEVLETKMTRAAHQFISNLDMELVEDAGQWAL
jgi:hypothetical protein